MPLFIVRKRGCVVSLFFLDPNEGRYLSPNRGGIKTYLCWPVVYKRQRSKTSVYTAGTEQKSAAAIQIKPVTNSFWSYVLWLPFQVERQEKDGRGFTVGELTEASLCYEICQLNLLVLGGVDI